MITSVWALTNVDQWQVYGPQHPTFAPYKPDAAEVLGGHTDRA
jgi:hypothetical protein